MDGITTIITETIEYHDGPECMVCGRPRQWCTDDAGRSVCGTGDDCGRAMAHDEPCWMCREIPADESLVAAIAALGRECAEGVLDASGSDPTDEGGRCLLPPEPVGGGWEALAELLGREISDEEAALFTETYQTLMAPAIERVEDGGLLVRVVEISDTTDLYCYHDGQDGEQPCVVELECEDGALTADYLVDTSTTPGEVWHGRTLQWGISLLTADAANMLMHQIAPLAQKILDGYSKIWDGSNHIGRLTETASEASDAIERMCDATTGDMVVEHASDWFRSCSPADLGVTADSTNNDLAQVAIDALEHADGDVHVIQGDMEFLEELRDELRDERDELREERWQEIADAADDEGTIQAADMVGLFPGQPAMHTATAGWDAMRAAGAPANFCPDGWSDPVGAAD